MSKYHRLDSSNILHAKTTKTTMTTTNVNAVDNNENDDDDNYAIYATDNNNENNRNAITTEGFSLFDELNNCYVNSAIDMDEHITMEIPLLGNSNSSSNNNNEYDHQHNYHINYCRCEQPGFSANLTSKSTQDAKFKIVLAISLCCIFMLIEFVGGYIAGSLAIMTDAAHLASDCISFIIGLVAIWLGSRPPDDKMSFGYKRMEVLGAIISVLGIWILTATLVIVAMQRVFTNDYDLDANAMMTISGIGILINIIMVFILHGSVLPGASHGHSHANAHTHTHAHAHSHAHAHAHTPSYNRRSSYSDGNHQQHNLHYEDSNAIIQPVDISTSLSSNVTTTAAPATTTTTAINGNGLKKVNNRGMQNERNLNLRAAMIHVIGDLVQSVGVFLASVLIKIYPNARIADPLCTMLFSVIVIMTTVQLFRESVGILMDAVPHGFKLNDLECALGHIDGVKSVHHLNVWNHTANYSILMVHLVIDFLADSNLILEKATNIATGHKYNIKHCTIQIERLTA